MSNSQNEDHLIKDLLSHAKTIAVVGLSEKPDRPSFEVAQYLQKKGYKIIPVNPAVKQVLGEKSYASLKDIPVSVSIDIVDIFRKPEFISEIVDEAIEVNAKAIWMQLGLSHEEASQKAHKAGLKVIQDRCLLIEHRRLFKK